MRAKSALTLLCSAALIAASIAPASATPVKASPGMTHLKTAPGLSLTLGNAGIVLYAQGGATSAVMGDSIAAVNGQVVFHIPITNTKDGVQHLGSVLVFFNLNNKKQVLLRNPVINLSTGVITANIAEGASTPVTVLTIANASTLKPTVKDDRKTRLRTTVYAGAQLTIAPGVGAVLTSALGLSDGTIADATVFGSADLSLYSRTPRK